jgi:threonyl-tRNA synthetase
VREGQVAQYNFILVIGQQEVENRTINVRTRDNEVKGAMSITDLLQLFASLTEKFE